MEISLDLSKHCIQTEIKKLYSKTVGICIRKGVDINEMEDRIEILRESLECLDFGILRSKYRELCGGDPAILVFLLKSPEGRIYIRINGTDIVPDRHL